VKETKVNKIKNSLLVKSRIFSLKNLLKEPPKDTLLKRYILYAADNTIDVLDIAPSKGNLSNIPYSEKNSPTKFNVRGVPQLAKQRIKKKIENKGFTCASPLNKAMDLVPALSYNTPPTQKNKPVDVNP
jgi:hypothetical protein